MKKHLGGVASGQETGVLGVDQEVVLAKHHLGRGTVQRSGGSDITLRRGQVVTLNVMSCTGMGSLQLGRAPCLQ